jgi:CHAD domain-containing protein
MAKAYEIADLNCQADATEGVSKVLLVRMKQIADLAKPALEENNIEGIHDLRVSIRRLRSALRDFSLLLKKSSTKRMRKDLKKLARLLGSVRDVDVEIEMLKKLKQDADQMQIQNSIEKLIQEKSRFRSEAFKSVFEELTDSVENLSLAISELVLAIPKAKISFTELGGLITRKNLSEFLALSKNLFSPFDIEGLHELRIAGKRLRYSLELFSPCANALSSFAESLAKMQGFLGDLHDCDIWTERLKNDLLEERVEKEVSIWLLSEFAKRRAKSYSKALRLWQEWESSEFTEKLQEVLYSL